MSFRTKLLIATATLVVFSLFSLGHLIRRETTIQLSEQFSERVSAIAALIQNELDAEGQTLRGQLSDLGEIIQADNRLRRALIQEQPDDRDFLIDYATRTMRLTALDIFQIQNDSGRVLSSGHFRNEFGRLRPGLADRLNSSPDSTALFATPTVDGTVMALTRSLELVIGPRRFAIVGGVSIGSVIARLNSDINLTVELVNPEEFESRPRRDTALTRIVPIAFIGEDVSRVGDARILITHSDAPLREVDERIDSRIMLFSGLTLVFALGLTLWIVRFISRPLDELAEKTARLDIDRLDVTFASKRQDELGKLSRLLDDLVVRLRTSTSQLRDVERKAAVGDLARQVNHDIKNGLTPIRNVFNHLADVSRDQPDQLETIFAERRQTIESSLEYLGGLAENYARLTPKMNNDPCDLNTTVRDVVTELADNGTKPSINLQLHDGLTNVLSDRVVLRRIIENLVTNAVDAAGVSGSVTVTTAPGDNTLTNATALLEIADTGAGMTEEQLERAFEDFFTTKQKGTGLGLSVVRRLVLDLGGTLGVKTEPDFGTCFRIQLPVTGTAKTGVAQ